MTTVIPAYGIDLSEFDNVGLKYKYVIISDGNKFEVSAVANFQIVSHVFSENEGSLTFNVETGKDSGNDIEFYIPKDLIGFPNVLLNGHEVSAIINETDNIFYIAIDIEGKDTYVITIIDTKNINIESQEMPNSGGCLIATAAFGSELAPQVQLLREIRDDTVLQTESGASFMAGFNQFYYLFSPAVADYERENPTFKESVKLILTPLLVSLTLLQYADIDSESEILVYGVGIILLNFGMYFVVPAIVIVNIRKRVSF